MRAVTSETYSTQGPAVFEQLILLFVIHKNVMVIEFENEKESFLSKSLGFQNKTFPPDPSMGLENLFPSSEGWHVWNYSSDINIFNSFESEIADFHVKEKHMKRKKKKKGKYQSSTEHHVFIYLFKRYFTDCSFKPFHKSRVDSCSTSPWLNARYWWEELTGWIGRTCLRLVRLFGAFGLWAVVQFGEVFRHSCQGTVPVRDAVLHIFRKLCIAVWMKREKRILIRQTDRTTAPSCQEWWLQIITIYNDLMTSSMRPYLGYAIKITNPYQ